MTTHVVIIGAGLGGLRVAERLRRSGYDGSLILLGEETHRPYDRPPLSKAFLTGAEPTFLRAEHRWATLDLDLRLGVRAAGVDLRAGHVHLDRGNVVPFDRLVVATGVRARTVPEWASPRVFSLRTLDDATRLRAALTSARRVAVVGAGVLGSEVAATARSLGLEVHLVDPLPAPLAAALPRRLGDALASLHLAHGVRLHLGSGVAAITGSASAAEVLLDDGTALGVDLVLAATGSLPNVELLEGSGLRVDRGLLTDLTMTTSDPRVLAVGDVARVALPGGGGHRAAEHWDNASSTAALVATNLLLPAEQRSELCEVPYFWTDHYDVKLQVLGTVGPTDRLVVVSGRPADGRYLALHLNAGGGLVGVSGAGDPAVLNRCRRALVDGWSVDELLDAAPWTLSGSAATPRP